MKARKTVYSSPKLEIVPFDEEDILTVSTHGDTGAGDPDDNGGSGTVIDAGGLQWDP